MRTPLFDHLICGFGLPLASQESRTESPSLTVNSFPESFIDGGTEGEENNQHDTQLNLNVRNSPYFILMICFQWYTCTIVVVFSFYFFYYHNKYINIRRDTAFDIYFDF